MKTSTLEEVDTLNAAAPLHVLIVENLPNDVALILLELRKAGLYLDHTLAENKEQFRRALQDDRFDAILCDYRLPGWTGMEALQELLETGRDIPFLLVTGTLGEEAAVECIKQGATDYILKDRMSRLPVALKRAIGEKALRDEAKRAQIVLAESAARACQRFAELDLLYRSLPVALAVFGRDMRFLRVNDEISRFDGIPVSAHIGLTIWEVTPDFAKAAEGYLRKVFQTGEAISNIELQGGTLQKPDAVRKWLCNFYPLRGEDGAVSAATVMAIDITDRKRTEQALSVSEARNRDLVEHAIYGISRVAADGSFLDENAALLSMLGCNTAEELHELNLMRDVFRFPEQYAELMASCREQGELHGAESEWRRCDGGIVTVRLHVRLLSIPDHAGAIEIIAEDVTELRAMERQLRQSQKFEAIGQLAGGIAHDFNNVVGAILGWAELGLEQNRANPQVADRFARIREQGERAADLRAAAGAAAADRGRQYHHRRAGQLPGQSHRARHRAQGHHLPRRSRQGLFRVYLPAHQGTPAEGIPAKAPAPAHVEMRGTETIVIAEDHESIREMARQTLLNLGCRVLSASDGEEALRLCGNESPALAILDVIMPKLGGPAAASRLTALFAGLPILFTSGYSEDSENVLPGMAEARYLQKPYSPTTLGRSVREMLDQARTRKQSS
jgi:PAS domain S-box-containing protein